MAHGIEYIEVEVASVTVDLDEYADEAKAFVADRFNPEDVFDEDALIRWAEANGFVHTHDLRDAE